MALAVVVAIVLTSLLPKSVRLGPAWLIPIAESVLLVLLCVKDPGRIDRRSQLLRGCSIALVSVLLLTAMGFTVRLIAELIHGGSTTDSASALLLAGNAVWISNNIAFALLYWELDSGGSAVRAHRLHPRTDFAFPQQLNPIPGWEDWQPRFVDYLYLGFTNATAFSPTDVMPLAPWTKMTMLVQSIVSLTILGLIVARAVNVLT
jgi:uncharacterized membrane protein